MTAIETHSIEWHAKRASGIGGSDIAALLGLSRYQSPWSLWAEKSGLLPTKQPANVERLDFGRDMEPVLARLFHRRTGLHVAGEQMMVRHQVHHFARATLDGLVVESDESTPDDALGPVQFKTWGTFGWPDGVPAAIRAQTIWEAGCLGGMPAWVGVMFAGFRFEVFEIPWDETAEADWLYMLERAREFWALVESGNPPEVDGSDATHDAIAAIWPTDLDGAAYDATPEVVEMLGNRAAISARIRADEAVVKQITNELAVIVGDSSTIRIGGVPAWTYRAQSRRTIDREALERDHPDLAASYSKTSTYRVLRPAPKAKEIK